MRPVRGAVFMGVLVAAAVGTGFLIGYPSDVIAATTTAFAATAALTITRELAARVLVRDRATPGVAESPAPDQLRRVSEALESARASEFGVDRDLRPLLQPIAATRLARRGVDLDRNQEEARAVLGESLWEVVRMDRMRGSNGHGRGITDPELESLIGQLERF